MTLECQLTDSRHDVVWLKGDKRVYPSSKFKVDRKGSFRTLTIVDPVKLDEAVYSCALKHDPTRRTSSALHIDSSMIVFLS